MGRQKRAHVCRPQAAVHCSHPRAPCTPDPICNLSLARRCKALFTELELGESVLRYAESDGVVLREVRVVKVRIQRPDAPNESLVEARQIFADGRERARGTPLSEKVLLWEGPVAAARRGVLEELGPALGPRASSILIDDASLTAWEETRQSSSSYPTLATRYLLHQVDALVAGLPSTAFSTLEKCALTAAAAAAAGYNARALRRRHRRLVASAAITPKRVLSASGRPLELPCDLRHVWEWWPIEECVAAAAQVRAAASVPPTVAAA